MNNILKSSGLILIAFFLTLGCAHKKPLLPVHDEVLVYQLPYDLTYLRVLDSLQTLPDWELEVTDKEAGFVRVRNMNYGGLDDADKRTATFLIKRINLGETSVELAPESQQVIGVGDLMKAVGKYLSREV